MRRGDRARRDDRLVSVPGVRDGGNGERGVKGMVLISTVVGGLFLYVIFERYLKKGTASDA
jgi:hypothetical protein